MAGKIHFENKDYFQGLRLLAEIKNNRIHKESIALKKNGIAGVTDVETLRMMLENYPKDEVIGEKLAREVAKNQAAPGNQALLDSLIDVFRLKKSDFVEEAPPTIHKDVYSISLLFPFLTSTLEPTISRKRNQFILDLYEGMKLAVDTLSRQGIKLSLRAYDTERDPEKIKGILEKEELINTDLIVGPLFQEENGVVQEFSRNHKINLFNPVSNNVEWIADNPYAFLFQPSHETLGARSAEFLATHQKNKKCMVFLGESKSDSVMAMGFLRKAAETDLEIIQIEKVSRIESSRIISILATPTEFDEFKYPIQFTLPIDSLGCVFVASEDPLIYTKVISSVETRKDSTTIVGSEKWLDQSAVDYEKYQSMRVVLFAPNFTRPQNRAYRNFQYKFNNIHGRVTSSNPYSDYAKLGFDFILFIGHALKKHGVYFQDAFSKEKFPGYLTEGFDYRLGRDNQLVPFIQFSNGELVLIDTKTSSQE
jgi:hypothetical protein